MRLPLAPSTGYPSGSSRFLPPPATIRPQPTPAALVARSPELPRVGGAPQMRCRLRHASGLTRGVEAAGKYAA